MKKLAILVVGLMLVAAACNKNSDTNNDPYQTPDNSNTQTPPADETPTGTTTPPATKTVTINMTASGFSPANVTIKKGDSVVFKNTDSNPHWPASAPHPTHTALPGFDALKGIAAGASYSYTFTKVGAWGYHDHLNSSLFGKVTVTE